MNRYTIAGWRTQYIKCEIEAESLTAALEAFGMEEYGYIKDSCFTEDSADVDKEGVIAANIGQYPDEVVRYSGQSLDQLKAHPLYTDLCE